MAGLKRALKAVGAAKQQRAASGLAAGYRGGIGGGSGGGSGGGGVAKAAAAAVHLGLYVEIANHYLYYFEKGVGEMSASVVSQVGGLLGVVGGTDFTDCRHHGTTPTASLLLPSTPHTLLLCNCILPLDLPPPPTPPPPIQPPAFDAGDAGSI